MSTPLFEEFLASSDTLRIYDEGKLIFASNEGGVCPLVAYLADHGPSPRPVTLFDKVMGNAAALLSVRVNSREVYSPLGSRLAVETLERYGIRYHLNEIVPCHSSGGREGHVPHGGAVHRHGAWGILRSHTYPPHGQHGDTGRKGNELEKIRLGKTNMMVTRLGFGGIPIQRLTEAEAVAVVRRCLDLGINYFDTANGYTTSEERIGKAIRGRREEVILATKTFGRTREEMESHLKLSLKRLGVDYIDLYQFHQIGDTKAMERVLDPENGTDKSDGGASRRRGSSGISAPPRTR